MSQEKFHLASKRERELLTKIIPLLMKNRSYDYTLTPIEGFDKYDGILMYNGKMILLEVKIREKHYDQLYLEKIKYDDLMKIKKEGKYDAIYYINETPQGIYMARIDDKQFNHISYVLCPVSTMDPNKGKVKKAVYELDVENDFKKIGIKKPI